MSAFLHVPKSSWTASNALAFAFRDAHPVSPGHTLVCTRRVVADWFSATEEERAAVMQLVEEVKRQLDQDLHPDGYNVGFNAGIAAGQTVMHLHVHVIPRYRGDMDDPRGGVRHVIPSKGNYLRSVEPLATGGEDDPFARHVMPLFGQAEVIAIVAAFVQASGLRRIGAELHRAIARGAQVRIVAGDYLEITQSDAIDLLVDWQRAVGLGDDDEDPETARRGSLETRIIETRCLPGRSQSFHPKSWRFEAPGFGIAFVGSSNLSLSALGSGVEWNLRVDRDRDAHAYRRICEAFDRLWGSARVLDEAWADAYRERTREVALALPPGEVEVEPLEPVPEPHQVQIEALAKLRAAREEGRRRALVVLATGLGKTWLAAFDYRQLREEHGGRPRVLFVAHRREILRQAAETYRRLVRDLDRRARFTWFLEDQGDLSGDFVFASVAKLARAAYREKLRLERFDYVVVDEVHHAAADSYRKILDTVDARFLLGLTATPDRGDSRDILGLFDDFVAYRADIPRGVALKRLAPFHYFGVKDEIDYENIPWRNRRFDQEVLARAAQTEARMETLWRAWREHPGQKSLLFCCSIAHAIHVRDWLRARNVRAAAVFSGEGTDDRDASIEQLERGELDAVCAVDIFNEGVDIPSADRVVMLRPTESSVVFLQQLGRGLRASEGKDAVTLVDFVGNHSIFLERVRALLSFGGAETTNLRAFLDAPAAQDLPEGCSVELELEAKDVLRRLFRADSTDEVERAYRELRIIRGERPTAGELQRMGYLPSKLRARHGSWFDFVRTEGDATPDEHAALGAAHAFLREVETTDMTKSFKMITLEAVVEADALFTGTSLRDVAARSHAILRRSPELFADIVEDERASVLTAANERRWIAYWMKNPINAWTTAKKGGRPWFRVEGDMLLANFAVEPAARSAVTACTRELVDYRLAHYRAGKRVSTASATGFVCKVLSNQRDPILKLPSRRTGDVPRGETDVRLPNGSAWQFRFMEEFCNVARPPGRQRNELPDLLRSWFGPRAGTPGTAFEVRFRASPDGLWAEPLHGNVIELRPARCVVTYPDLRAAAGHAEHAVDDLQAEKVMLPIEADDPTLFAVRVAGSSMDGGSEPMRDGDWAVMRLARSAGLGTLENRVILVEVPGEAFGSQFQIKRLRRRDRGWVLASDNPDGPTIEPREDTIPIARLERIVRPEDLAPAVGTIIDDDDLGRAFGLEELAPQSGRSDGHLFIFVDRQGMVEATDRIRYAGTVRKPGETAYALARVGEDTWRYLGVARATETETLWQIPDVDYATWHSWGASDAVSRPVPDGLLSHAQLVVDAILRLEPDQRWLARGDGRRARVIGTAAQGGLRIDGGEGGFQPRTVSLADIAWVIAAAEDVDRNGGLLDEERVNRLRYLEGTPKASTRWIDTGWAIAAWALASPLIREAPAANEQPLLRVHRDDGTPIDATFRIEEVGDALTIVIESRGGTRGSTDERNVDYAEGLELILARLKAGGHQLLDVLVDSRDTAGLPPEGRRLQLPSGAYPLAIDDPARLRKEICASQSKIGRKPGARGSGNRTKRLRIFVTRPMSGARDFGLALSQR